MWTLSRIAVYPIKSLDPVFLEQTKIRPSGALVGDRQYALFDQAENVINGKKYPDIHRIRSQFDLAQQTVSLSSPDTSPQTLVFHLIEQRTELENWFSEYFHQQVTLKENSESGFPDDLAAPGPTIISTETYEELARWFPEITVDELRLRFRANLEFTGDFPFCEDRLYSTTDSPVLFQIGSIILAGSNPCKRCVVPSRNPLTGDTDSKFMKTFIRKRKETFPTWAPLELFQNMYRLAVNTRLSRQPNEHSDMMRVGDPVEFLT
ncbi:hypothetical protein Pan241w_32880 [Gimesia alba]|uniref:MOSC domain-containing protein n=1 Tax=Gimesia alba TaxID=2527973 RepID=A0A517RH39_9PLAN|nr:MOSC N-terminal beta barrel domain-containing protein [Gimesia alba]QDT43189.1 hypothetical protein Pan241w_32880 [Gimesia alba]